MHRIESSEEMLDTLIIAVETAIYFETEYTELREPKWVPHDRRMERLRAMEKRLKQIKWEGKQ